MSKAAIRIVHGEQVKEVSLQAKGTILGRIAKCDVVLDSELVSRRHARIFQDPFGRWLIEDLGSRNGVKVAGRRVEVHAMLPGQEVTIGPFALSIAQDVTRQIPQDPDMSSTSTSFLTDSPQSSVVRAAERKAARLSRARLKRLNAIMDRLAGLPSSSTLYPELCRCMARAPGSGAVVLRISRDEHQLPQVLACHLGSEAGYTPAEAVGTVPLSRRVVAAVGSGQGPVMAASTSDDGAMGLTICDEGAPRTVYCAPVTDAGDTMDALYFDIPSDQAIPDLFDFFQAVARQAGFARKSLLLAEAKAEHQAVEHQLEMAREIQAKLTPRDLQGIGGVDLAIHYAPAMWVGGDYCDVWRLGDGRVALAIGDVSGKGLPAAMVMANLQASLRSTTAFCQDPAEVAAKINAFVLQNLPERMFVTLFLGFFCPERRLLEYINAGHVLPLVREAGGAVSALGEPSCMPMGIVEEPFEATSRYLSPGSALVLVTDGITEAASPQDELFGTERLVETLAAAKTDSAAKIVESIVAAATQFRDVAPQRDDVTVLTLVI